jgi:hypothetical protein
MQPRPLTKDNPPMIQSKHVKSDRVAACCGAAGLLSAAAAVSACAPATPRRIYNAPAPVPPNATPKLTLVTEAGCGGGGGGTLQQAAPPQGCARSTCPWLAAPKYQLRQQLCLCVCAFHCLCKNHVVQSAAHQQLPVRQAGPGYRLTRTASTECYGNSFIIIDDVLTAPLHCGGCSCCCCRGRGLPALLHWAAAAAEAGWCRFWSAGTPLMKRGWPIAARSLFQFLPRGSTRLRRQRHQQHSTAKDVERKYS